VGVFIVEIFVARGNKFERILWKSPSDPERVRELESARRLKML
jgi:hypothetical protein